MMAWNGKGKGGAAWGGKGAACGGKGWTAPIKPMFDKTPSWGKGGAGWGKGGGCGGGMDMWNMNGMMMMKGKGKGLRGFSNSVKVWVGSLPEGTSYQVLQQHMNQAGKAKFVTVFQGKGVGTAGVAYASAEEAANAVAWLNGSSLNGQPIVVDGWGSGGAGETGGSGHGYGHYNDGNGHGAAWGAAQMAAMDHSGYGHGYGHYNGNGHGGHDEDHGCDCCCHH